jgi:DNA-binding transcriptional regulator/RsmH inhibitor MraZ
MQGNFGEKHLHGIDPKGRLQLSRQIRDQLKLKKGERLHSSNIESPLLRSAPPPVEDYEQRFLAQAPGDVKRDFARLSSCARDRGRGCAGPHHPAKSLRDRCPLGPSVVVINVSKCPSLESEAHRAPLR